MGKRKFSLISDTTQVFLLGIAAHQSDYHMAWLLNQGLGWKLSQQKSLEISLLPGTDPTAFSRFSFQDRQETRFTLIANHTADGFLLDAWKNTDFLLWVSGDPTGLSKSVLIRQLRQIPGVLMAHEIPWSRKFTAFGLLE